MLEQDIKKPKKEPWRMPQDFRLVDFHKPLLSQPPIILLVLGTTVALAIALTIVLGGHGGLH